VREVLSTFRAEFAVEGIKCSLVLGKRYEELAVDHLVMDPARTQQVVSKGEWWRWESLALRGSWVLSDHQSDLECDQGMFRVAPSHL
jgi:hypothetical protein